MHRTGVYYIQDKERRYTMMTVKELVRLTGMTQKQYAEYFGIPFRTVQNWITGQEKCKEYWLKLMTYKLQKEGLVDIEDNESGKEA